MADAMVTGRMTAHKKSKGNLVLSRMGISASEAINILYDRLIADQDISCLMPQLPAPSKLDWERAFALVDSISKPVHSRFDTMSPSEIKADRLKSRGLL